MCSVRFPLDRHWTATHLSPTMPDSCSGSIFTSLPFAVSLETCDPISRRSRILSWNIIADSMGARCTNRSAFGEATSTGGQPDRSSSHAGYRARVEGLERHGQDYRRFIEPSPNSAAGHAQCAKGLDDQPCFEQLGGQMLLN